MKKGIGVLLVMLILAGCSVAKENTGSSLGNEMVISSSGEFSYYIGITVGGTGQCEANEGEISVEIEPYEAHSEEKEILTLNYENNEGMEYILMDWYGETLCWKRQGLRQKV